MAVDCIKCFAICVHSRNGVDQLAVVIYARCYQTIGFSRLLIMRNAHRCGAWPFLVPSRYQYGLHRRVLLCTSMCVATGMRAGPTSAIMLTIGRHIVIPRVDRLSQ